MKAVIDANGDVLLRMSLDEASVLHERMASSEWAEDLSLIELDDEVEKQVFSDVQQSLAPLIPGLGTESYGPGIDLALANLRRRRHG